MKKTNFFEKKKLERDMPDLLFSRIKYIKKG